MMLAATMLFAGCYEEEVTFFEERINELEEEIDEIEDNQIASIEKQIAATLKQQFDADDDVIKAYVRYTKTRAAGDIVELKVSAMSVGENGIFTLTIQDQGLISYDFWSGALGAVVYVQIIDQNGNNVVSDMIPMVAGRFPISYLPQYSKSAPYESSFEFTYLWPNYVDLGLPSGTLWADANVGANKPEEAGHCFAWGEIEPKETYDWSNYKWCKGSWNSITKYCAESSVGYMGFTDNITELDATDDAAVTTVS